MLFRQKETVKRLATMQKIFFKLVLRTKEFDVPFQFKGLTDISTDIFEQILNNPSHKYYVKSDVNDTVLKSFIDFWVQEIEPEINIDNYLQFYQLSEEFNIMKDLLISSKEKWNEYELNIHALNDPSINDKKYVEQNVAENLDGYIENYSEPLMSLKIQTLYNIFSHKDKKLSKNDRVYELIQQHYLKNQESSIFVLLQFIDMQKINYINLKDSILKSDQRFGYMPSMNVSIFDKLFSEIEQLREQNRNNEAIIREQQKMILELNDFKSKQDKENEDLKSLIQEIKSQLGKLQNQEELRKQRNQ